MLKFFIKIFLFALVFSPFLFATDLKEKFRLAEAGDYIVTQQSKTCTLLHIHALKEKKMVLEEISAPSHQIKEKRMNWKKWIAKGAPGHTCWVVYEIDLEKNQLTQCYSITRKAFLSTEGMNAFLITLLQIPLKPLPLEKRQRIGPPPLSEEFDYRKIWNPPMYVEGKRILHPQYTVFTILWPKDVSELSEKELELYFDESEKNLPFPYFIQITDGSLKFKIFTLDSGKNLYSPHRQLVQKIFCLSQNK